MKHFLLFAMSAMLFINAHSIRAHDRFTINGYFKDGENGEERIDASIELYRLSNPQFIYSNVLFNLLTVDSRMFGSPHENLKLNITGGRIVFLTRGKDSQLILIE